MRHHNDHVMWSFSAVYKYTKARNPISIYIYIYISFVSKLIERIVCIQLVDHLKENDMYEMFPSAYRQLHSTETALLRVQNAVDSAGGAILVLLDLSAAFDYIDVMMGAIVSQITSLAIVYSSVTFRRRSKETSKLRVTGLCEGNSPVTGKFPAQRASNAESVSIWWCPPAILSTTETLGFIRLLIWN